MAELYNFFGDIFDYIRETYLEVDFGSYKNFTVTTQGVTLSQIIIGILFGCMLASFAVVYQRTYLGRMVRGLLANKAHDEASAMTLADLGAVYQPYTLFKAYREGRVYGCNSADLLFHEETPFHPERLLRDYIRILHPELLVGDTLRYFHQL